MSATDNLADAYLKGAADLRAAVAGMTREQLVARPVAGKWSTLEVVCHIADFEPVLVDRMKRIIALGDLPLLLAADENQYAKTLCYHDRDAEEELALIDATRKSTARVIRSLSADRLQEQGVHSKRGLLTLERVIQMAVNHIPHHLPFVLEKKKALGV
jgi:uncharacterized damage-inducible protein DinB